MFDDIGGKIKKLAVIICWLGIISSVIMGIIIICSADTESYYGYHRTNGWIVFIGFVYMGLGALFSWIGSFVLYGYGEMIDNTDATQYDTREMSSLMKMYLPRLTNAAESMAMTRNKGGAPTKNSAAPVPPTQTPFNPVTPASNPYAAPTAPNYNASPAPHLISKRCATCGMVVNSNASAPATHCPNCGSVIM